MKTNFRLLFFMILAISLLIIPLTWIIFRSNWIITTGTSLEKSDWLSFWGSFLSYFGTIVLGLIVLWQNYTLFEVNKRLVEQGTIAQFYSEIEPIYLEIEKKKLDDPFLMSMMGNYAQRLVRSENSNKKEITGLWHIRLLFKKIRSFAPNSYNIESCEIYLDNENGETQKSIIGYCALEDKDKYFMQANKTEYNIKDGVIMSVFFACQENDDKIWKEYTEAKKLNMNMHFKYKNSFGIEAKSSIKIIWSNPKDQNMYKKFKTTDYFVYENKLSLSQEKK